MANKNNPQNKKILLGIVAVIICVVGSLFLGQEKLDAILDNLFSASGMVSAPTQTDGEVSVHFIDVGQGDCTLIQTSTQNVLIDAGERGNADTIISYLHEQNVDKLDLVVATHPHSDHIGSMPEVLDVFGAKEILFGNVPENLIPTTRIYEKLLDMLDKKDIPVTIASPDLQYDLGNGAQITVLGPVTDKIKDLNNTSVVCRLDYGKTSFLLTGDAEKESEEEILAIEKGKLPSTVLKLGHHGSHSSTIQEWLDAVNPEYAVALVGADNDYGHPHTETIQKLKKKNIPLYRSDLNGSIVFKSDGEKLSVSTEKEG